MKKILITLFMLLSCAVTVFAYSETDFRNDYAELSKLKAQSKIYAAQKDYANAYTSYGKMREKMIPMYQYLKAENITQNQIQSSIATLIANTYEIQAIIDKDIYNNPDKAASEYMGAVQQYCEIGDYTKAEADITEIINISGLNTTKLADSYKVRAQIREKLNNKTGAQEDYKKYNELISK